MHCRSTCSTEFAKHVLPRFTSPQYFCSAGNPIGLKTLVWAVLVLGLTAVTGVGGFRPNINAAMDGWFLIGTAMLLAVGPSPLSSSLLVSALLTDTALLGAVLSLNWSLLVALTATRCTGFCCCSD